MHFDDAECMQYSSINSTDIIDCIQLSPIKRCRYSTYNRVVVNEYDKRTAAGNVYTTIPEDYDIQLFFCLFHDSDGIHISLFTLPRRY